MLLAEFGGKLASLIFVVIVARQLGPASFGYFTFAVSFVPLFLVFSNWGISVLLVREFVRDRSRLAELFSSALLLLGGLGVLGLLASFTLAPLFVSSATGYYALVLVGLALFIDQLSMLVGAVFKAFEAMKFYALVVIVNRVLSTTFAGLVAVAGGGLVEVCLAYLVASGCALALGVTIVHRRFQRLELRTANRSLARRLFILGRPLGLAEFLNMAVYRVDAVMLQAIRGPVELALYGVAYRFFEVVVSTSWALGNVALPRIARTGRSAASTRMFGAFATLLACVCVPATVLVPFVDDWLVRTVFSPRYAEAASAVSILVAAAMFYGIGHLSRVSCVALGLRGAITAIAGTTLVANLAMNAYAIPRYGFVGAAWTTLITEVLGALLLVGLLSWTNEPPRLIRAVSAPAAAAALMGIVLAATGASGLEALILGIFVYLLALAAAVRLFLHDEAALILRNLRPLRADNPHIRQPVPPSREDRRTPRGVVITYHAIGDCELDSDPSHLFVSPAVFARHMRFLKRYRTVVPLEAVVTGSIVSDRRAVAITFDDGYRSVLRHAAPILRRHGFPATIFVPTRWIGSRNTWDFQGDCELELLDAAELLEARESGLSIESHGSGHIDFTTATSDEIERDLAASVNDLRAILGQRTRYVAYPYGAYADGLEAIVERLGFEAAFTIDRPHGGRYEFERVRITPLDSQRLFALKTSGHYSAGARWVKAITRHRLRRRREQSL